MNLIPFDHPEFGEVRFLLVGGKPHAVGVDVARALDYAKPSQAVIDHCKGIRKLGIPSAGGIQATNLIPEGDIYRLVVKAADQSRNPEIKAKPSRFEAWIFDEALPAIRETGSYALPKAAKRQERLSKAEKAIKGTILDFLFPNIGDRVLAEHPDFLSLRPREQARILAEAYHPALSE